VIKPSIQHGLYSGIKVGSNGVNVGLLQFADDTLFLCEAKSQNARVLKAILRSFELASGLRVNFSKTKVGGLGLDESMLNVFSTTLNCKHMKIPFVYLGMPIGGNPRSTQFWQPMIEKVSTRLSIWKGKLISMAGRLCLIKSVLSALPLYYLSFFKMPKGVSNKLLRIQRNFLWGWGSEAKKIAWVKWEKICKPKEVGGLDIRDIRLFNVALLAKWKWRLGMEDKGLWKQVLESKYGSWRNLNDSNISRSASRWWMDIYNVCGSTTQGLWFDKSFEWVLGEGNKVKFWEDIWAGEETLKCRFPRLYSISECKDRVIGEVGHWEDDRWEWDLSWRRQKFVWESNMEEQLLLAINGLRLRKGYPDTWKWKECEDGMFSVKSAYKALQIYDEDEVYEEFTMLWSTRVTPKAKILGWRVFLEKLPTKDKLLAKGVQLQHNLCDLCGTHEETIVHLFFSCRVAQMVWNMCDRWLRVCNVHHINPRANFNHFHLANLNSRQNLAWRGMWLATIGEIWNHRNGVIFKQRKVDPIEIFSHAQMVAWVWMKHKIPTTSFSYSDWILSPFTCLKSM